MVTMATTGEFRWEGRRCKWLLRSSDWHSWVTTTWTAYETCRSPANRPQCQTHKLDASEVYRMKMRSFVWVQPVMVWFSSSDFKFTQPHLKSLCKNISVCVKPVIYYKTQYLLRSRKYICDTEIIKWWLRLQPWSNPSGNCTVTITGQRYTMIKANNIFDKMKNDK